MFISAINNVSGTYCGVIIELYTINPIESGAINIAANAGRKLNKNIKPTTSSTNFTRCIIPVLHKIFVASTSACVKPSIGLPEVIAFALINPATAEKIMNIPKTILSVVNRYLFLMSIFLVKYVGFPDI